MSLKKDTHEKFKYYSEIEISWFSYTWTVQMRMTENTVILLILVQCSCSCKENSWFWPSSRPMVSFKQVCMSQNRFKSRFNAYCFKEKKIEKNGKQRRNGKQQRKCNEQFVINS